MGRGEEARAQAKGMCISFVLVDFEAGPRRATVVAFNRDEFLDRETRGPHWWSVEDGEQVVYGGRDLRAGGSWLGVTRSGRVALLTNFRRKEDAGGPAAADGEGGTGVDPVDLGSAASVEKSRGTLVKDFLFGSDTPRDYCERVRRDQYNGYNLVVGDLVRGDFAHVSNRDCPGVTQLAKGRVCGASNGPLGSWWKVRRGCSLLELSAPDLIGKPSLSEEDWGDEVSSWIFETVLSDETKAPREELQDTGFGPGIEMPNSSIYVEPFKKDGFGEFGTRSSTVILFDHDEGVVRWYERTYQQRERDSGGLNYEAQRETFGILVT